MVGSCPPLTHAETQESPSPEALPSTSTAIIHAQPTGESDTGEVEKICLDDDILQLLGDAPEPETVLGKAIHNDIATRWQDILKKGLGKDAKDNICKEYLIPSNCELLVPPILNPEAKAALTEQSVKRDASLVHRQKQLGIAISALAQATENIIHHSKESNKADLRQTVLKPISDACRLLCDMHNGETKIRRKFVISSINTSLKDTLLESASDKFLFGDNMSDKLKAAKSVQRSGEALKVIQNKKPQSQRPSFFNKNRSNFKTLHQKSAGKPDAGKPPLAPRHQHNHAPPPSQRRARPRSPTLSAPRKTTRR